MRRWGSIGIVIALLGAMLYFQLAPPPRAVSSRTNQRPTSRSLGEAPPALSQELLSSEEEALPDEPPLTLNGTEEADAQESEAPAPPGTASVWGEVTDAQGRPLEGVSVLTVPSEFYLEGPRTESHTDAQGRFRVRALTPGPYTFIFKRERFLPKYLDSHEITSSPEPLFIQLQPAPTLQGHVVDSLGNPLADMEVTLHRRPPIASPKPKTDDIRERTRTGADGTFILDTPEPGEWRLRAEGEGFNPIERDVTSPARNVRLMLGSGASVEVTVVDEQDHPVPGARVALGGGPLEGAWVEARTNEAGDTVLRGLEPGEYMVLAISPSESEFRLATHSLSAQGEKAQRVRLRFEPGPSLSGIITDRAGRSVADVEISARLVEQQVVEKLPIFVRGPNRMKDTRFLRIPRTRTGSDGRFTLSPPLPLSYQLSFNKLGYALVTPEPSGSLLASPGQSDLRVVLTYQGRVSGRVVGADGEPLSSFELNGHSHTSPDGTFTVEAGEPGRHTLEVLAPGVGGLQREYEAREGEDVDVGALVLGEGRPLRVLVEDAATFLPIHDADLVLREDPEGRQLASVELGHDRTPSTDTEGLCVLPDVPARPLSLTAERKGYEPGRMMLGSRQREVSVHLRPWATVQGWVRIGGVPMAEGEVGFRSPDGSHEEDLKVRDGWFSGHPLRPGRYMVQVDCDGCEEPEPVFLSRWVDVPGPGKTLSLNLEDVRTGATVEVVTFPSLRRLGLVAGSNPLPTHEDQFNAALALRLPKEHLEETLGYRFRHVPAGRFTLLGLQEKEDGTEVFLRQEIDVPEAGLLRIELQPR